MSKLLILITAFIFFHFAYAEDTVNKFLRENENGTIPTSPEKNGESGAVMGRNTVALNMMGYIGNRTLNNMRWWHFQKGEDGSYTVLMTPSKYALYSSDELQPHGHADDLPATGIETGHEKLIPLIKLKDNVLTIIGEPSERKVRMMVAAFQVGEWDPVELFGDVAFVNSLNKEVRHKALTLHVAGTPNFHFRRIMNRAELKEKDRKEKQKAIDNHPFLKDDNTSIYFGR